MRPKKHKTRGSTICSGRGLDTYQSTMKHDCSACRARSIDWIDGEIARSYSVERRPTGISPLHDRELFLLKHIYGLSDEGVCDALVHDPISSSSRRKFCQATPSARRLDLSHGASVSRRTDWRVLLAESLRCARHRAFHGDKTQAGHGHTTTRQPRSHHLSDPSQASCHAAIKGSTAWREARRAGCGNPIQHALPGTPL